MKPSGRYSRTRYSGWPCGRNVIAASSVVPRSASCRAALHLGRRSLRHPAAAASVRRKGGLHEAERLKRLHEQHGGVGGVGQLVRPPRLPAAVGPHEADRGERPQLEPRAAADGDLALLQGGAFDLDQTARRTRPARLGPRGRAWPAAA